MKKCVLFYFAETLRYSTREHKYRNTDFYDLYEIRESLYALLNEASLKRHFFLAMSASVSATCIIVHKNWYYTRKHIG